MVGKAGRAGEATRGSRLRFVPSLVLVGLALIALPLGLGCVSDGAQGSAPEESPDPTVSSYEAPGVRLELVADVDRIQPGVRFRLGLLVTLEPGWFVPARGPQGAGLPAVELTMPYDFQAGPVRWPAATPLTAPDGTTRQGYRDRVLAVSRIQASNVDADVDWPFRADLDMEVCAAQCVPVRTTLTLLLPHSVSGTRLEHFAHERLFDEWESRPE